MSLTGGSKFILTGGANYQIARSLRFRSSASAYLNRTAGTPTSSTTFIWSGWVKRGSLSTNNSIVGGFDGSSYDDFRFQSTDVLRFYVDAAAGSTIDTVALFRDPSAVYHVILAIDTTQSTQSNRCFIIVNGVAQTLTGNALSSNYSFLYFNKGTKVQNIGRFGYNATAYNDCYKSEINFVDGYPTGVTQGTWSASIISALFGTTDATTGAWTPKAYSGAFGKNGYYLNFSDNSGLTPATLGKDTSGANVLSTTGTTASSTALTAIAGTVSPQVGQVVTGSGIPANTYLTAVGGVSGAWTATMSAAATTTVVGGALVFTGNNWTLNNISITAGVTNDSLVDTPTNYGTEDNLGGTVRGNYPTLNPLKVGASMTLSSGNLAVATSSLNATRSVFATQGSSTQKFFFEVTPSVNSNGNLCIGVANENMAISTDPYIDANGWGFSPHTSSPQKNNGSYGGYGTSTASMGVGSTFICAVDPNNGSSGKIYVGVANAWMASSDPTTGTSPMFSNLSGTLFPVLCHDSGSSQSVTADINFGQRAFVNTSLLAGLLAAGYKPLNTQNLPDPAIPKPSLYMDVNTRTGTGAAGSVSGKLFSPDLVWTKNRTDAATSHAIFDSVRGVQKFWSTDSQAVEDTNDTQSLTTFNSDGFSFGTGASSANINTSAKAYVDWLWDASVTAGMSITSYVGNGGTKTVAHGLGAKPDFFFIRHLDYATTAHAQAWHKGLTGDTYRIKLSDTAAQDSTTMWTAIDSTNVSFTASSNGAVNNNGTNFMLYAWVGVAGFSKFGSCTGNGNTDGPFVWCGFRPRWIMIKNTTNGAVNWLMWDSARTTYNLMDYALYPNGSNAEASGWSIDSLSNGFKLRDNEATLNESGSVHIFAAFAEAPFKTARAR